MMAAVKRKATPVCPRQELHTPGQPVGYLQWHAWAEQANKTHKQRRCPGCGRWEIWEERCG